jgi:hypothetical protein
MIRAHEFIDSGILGWAISCPGCLIEHRLEWPRFEKIGCLDEPSFCPDLEFRDPVDLPPARFPVAGDRGAGLRSIPWDLLENHAERVGLNHHGQSLDSLAAHGGLTIREIAAILANRPPRFEIQPGDEQDVREAVHHWYAGRRESRCHARVVRGEIRFFADCTHRLAGVAAMLPDVKRSERPD